MGPSGASMRAGRNGTKIVKNRCLLPTDRFNAVKTRKNLSGSSECECGFPTIRGGRSNLGFALSCGAVGHRGGRQRIPLCSNKGAAGGAVSGSIKEVFDGMAMKGNQDGTSGKSDAGVKASRRDRLKLALRENLKRRKSQARGRSDAASSENDDASLDTAGGKS
jgi:hypothetical protein